MKPLTSASARDNDFDRGTQMRRHESRGEQGRRDRGAFGMGADCGALRRACMHKNEMGEEGTGNRAHYRRMCR